MMKSSFQAVSVLLSIEYVSGHGYTTDPPARAYGCYKEANLPEYKNTPGCKQIGDAQWEPQSVGNLDVHSHPQEVVPSNICGGGDPRFKGVSHAPASDWKATTISPVGGKFHWKYHATKPHTTSYWEVYQTTAGWTGQSELKWSDLKRFCRIDENGKMSAANSEYDCPFPEATGNPRDIILVLWNMFPRDSSEMFFSCSDVVIKGGGGGVQPKPTISKPSKPKTTTKLPQPTKLPSPSPKKNQGKLSNFPNPSIQGYITSWSAKKVGSVEEMGQNGYNVAYLSFAKVAGTEVGLWDNGTIGPNGTFKYSGKQDQKTPIVILSLGGANHATWKPDFGKAKELAQNMVTYCARNALHGVDFDLEGQSLGIQKADVAAKYDKVRDLIAKIRTEAESRESEFPRGFFITAAPQTSGNDLYWAGAGAQGAVFDEMLKPNACGGRACFDAVLIQNYNALKMSPKHAWLDITKPLLKGNEFTQVIMGYDLATAEWGGNFPVKLRDGVTETNSAIESASDFAQGNYSEVTGVFVWTADDDAHGGGERNGSAGNYAWAKAMLEYYPTNGKGSRKKPAPQPEKETTAPPPVSSQKKKQPPPSPETSTTKNAAPKAPEKKVEASKILDKMIETIKELRTFFELPCSGAMCGETTAPPPASSQKKKQPPPSPETPTIKNAAPKACSACAGKKEKEKDRDMCKAHATKTSCEKGKDPNSDWWVANNCKKTCCEIESCGGKKK